jgi:hypothetical protein
MYSKYDEMRVIKQVMQNYADNQKRQYESTITMLKEQSNNFPLDINSDRTNTEISSLQSKVSSLSDYRADYQSALSVVSELNKATMCYEQGYTQENIQSGLADERAKEGNKIFHDVRTQNPEYKRIMDEIAYSLFVAHDPMIEGLDMNFDAKEESLGKDFEAGKITKEQLIYYTNMCWALTQNKDYVDYMSQFQQQEEQAPMHR